MTLPPCRNDSVSETENDIYDELVAVGERERERERERESYLSSSQPFLVGKKSLKKNTPNFFVSTKKNKLFKNMYQTKHNCSGVTIDESLRLVIIRRKMVSYAVCFFLFLLFVCVCCE